MHLRRMIVCVLGVMLAGACVSPPPDAYVKPQQPDEQLATLDWGGGVWGGSRSPDVTEIDGQPVAASLFGSSTRLAPGPHAIDFTYSIYRGLYAIPLYAYVARSLSFEAEAAHVYRLRTECEHLGSSQCSSWIEDKSADIVVAGSLPHLFDRDLAARSDKAEKMRKRKALFDAQLASVCADARSESDIALYFFAGIAPIGETDLAMAYAWYSLAASRGDAEAGAVRNSIARDLSEDQIAQAREAAESLRLTVCREETDAELAKPADPQGLGDGS